MIRFDKVTKRYSNGHEALVNVSFHIPIGEMVFLTGHSGAGKTTLLKIIMHLERFNQGQVFVNGKNLSRISSYQTADLRRSIGLIPQNPQLLPQQTVFENVALPLIIAGHRPIDIGKRVRAALDKVGLLNKEKFFPEGLSAGEQQRVGIARAVVNRPPLLLADEPTGNLDRSLAMEIIQLFREFNHVGITILIATHDLSLIAASKQPLLTLKEGHLVLI